MSKLDVNQNRKIYQCSKCGNLFNWNNQSSWFGSYKQMEEDPSKLKYYCSNKCAER